MATKEILKSTRKAVKMLTGLMIHEITISLVGLLTPNCTTKAFARKTSKC